MHSFFAWKYKNFNLLCNFIAELGYAGGEVVTQIHPFSTLLMLDFEYFPKRGGRGVWLDGGIPNQNLLTKFSCLRKKLLFSSVELVKLIHGH